MSWKPVKDYVGRNQAAQDLNYERANAIAREADGELLSRQAIAVLRVLTDEIETLKRRISNLENQHP